MSELNRKVLLKQIETGVWLDDVLWKLMELDKILKEEEAKTSKDFWTGKPLRKVKVDKK